MQQPVARGPQVRGPRGGRPPRDCPSPHPREKASSGPRGLHVSPSAVHSLGLVGPARQPGRGSRGAGEPPPAGPPLTASPAEAQTPRPSRKCVRHVSLPPGQPRAPASARRGTQGSPSLRLPPDPGAWSSCRPDLHCRPHGCRARLLGNVDKKPGKAEGRGPRAPRGTGSSGQSSWGRGARFSRAGDRKPSGRQAGTERPRPVAGWGGRPGTATLAPSPIGQPPVLRPE